MKLRRTHVAAIVLALAVAGCGGANGGGDGAGRGDGSTVTATEFAFDPVNLSIEANIDVEVTLENGGAIEHEWVVIEQGTTIETEAEFNDSMVAVRIGSVQPGEEATGTVNLAAGEYQVACLIVGHFDAGMEGTLTVGG